MQARTAPVLAIPLWDVHGQRTGWQIRPDSPRLTHDGKAIKYENPKGTTLRLDVHPHMQPLLGDPRTPLWITEGIPKGDALPPTASVPLPSGVLRALKGPMSMGARSSCRTGSMWP